MAVMAAAMVRILSSFISLLSARLVPGIPRLENKPRFPAARARPVAPKGHQSSTGEDRVADTPLVYGGILYMPNPNDHLQAIDAVSGDLLSEYRREAPEDAAEVLPAPERPLGHGPPVRAAAGRHGGRAGPDAVSWINPRLRAGEVRKAITGIPRKTGVVYTLDRETGQFLWATPTVAQNLISDIDGATGEVTENPEVVFSAYGQQVLSCPGWLGGKDWEAGAYSPLTNTMYYPLRNSCARVLATPDEGLAIYQLAARFQLAPGTDQLGTVRAISAETGRPRRSEFRSRRNTY